MTPAIFLPGIAKLASVISDAVKHAASKVNFANTIRHVEHVAGQAPGAPRLVRVHSHEEGRAALNLKSGFDPSLEQRRSNQDSPQHFITGRRSPRQDVLALATWPGTPPSYLLPCDWSMPRAKLTLGRLADSYAIARKTSSSDLRDLPAASLAAQELPRTTSIESASTFGSSVAHALRRVFSPSKLTPGEKLWKLKVELRDLDILYSPCDRGDRAMRLLDQVVRKQDSDGDLAAYVYAKQHIAAVRKAGLSIATQFYENPGPSRLCRSL